MFATSDAGQGMVEYSLALSLLLILSLGFIGAIGGWSFSGESGAVLAQRAPHSLNLEGGIPTWIGDAAVH